MRIWPAFDAALIDSSLPGLWRYHQLMPLEPAWQPISLGEGNTPLLPVQVAGRDLHFKLEFISPTGSFKDRGACVLVTALRGLGIEHIVEDSSGNAGASLSAYAAHAGIACEICVPNTAAGPKLGQMKAHGSEVIEIKGKREYAALAAWAAAAHGAYYASHRHNPYFLAGIETLAFELWEQLGQSSPESLILPVGNGTLLLGIYRGFLRLQQAGLTERLPQLLAVQAEACTPIYQAFHYGRESVDPVVPGPTTANALAIGQPVRGAQILTAIRSTGGSVLSVSEEQIAHARNQLARQGFYVEPASAVAVAALADLPPEPASGPIVVPLTGHGLKINRSDAQ